MELMLCTSGVWVYLSQKRKKWFTKLSDQRNVRAQYQSGEYYEEENDKDLK
jgi:hypothetical protein